MTQVIVPSALGGDGLPFSDDGTSERDMRGQGYASHFMPLVAQAMLALKTGVQAAGAVAAGSTNTSSTTSLTIGAGAMELTVETGKALVRGMVVMLAYRAAPSNYMVGQVSSYDAGTGALSLNVTVTSGTGTYADWVGSVTGLPAMRTIAHRAMAGANTVAASDLGKYLPCTGSFTLAFAPAAVLGAGWWCYLQNAGAGDITLDPDGAETIDGIAGFVLYPGAVRLVLCDGAALRSIPIVGGTKTFTTTGSYVWAPGVQQWDADLIAGGAGGGGGARAAARYNGGGGGAGERWKTTIALSEVVVGATVTCTVGAKGAGGAAATGDNLPASAGPTSGADGGTSSIGALRSVEGGKANQTGAYTSAHGQGGRGGGKAQAGTNSNGAGQQYTPANSALVTEWAGPTGVQGSSAGPITAVLGRQKGGNGGAGLANGADGANGVNPGDGGGGGAGNFNGSPAGKGGDGVDGKITIVEVI